MFARFVRNEAGVTAIMFGLALIPIALAAGSAIDYTNGARMKAKLQEPIDVAGLAAVKNSGSEMSTAKSNFDGLADRAGFIGANSTWTFDGSGKLSGNATAAVPTAFMQLAGLKSMTVTASVVVQQSGLPTPDEVIISVNYAKGWYWKRLTIWKQDTATSSPALLATYTYQPTSLLNGGTGTQSGDFGTPIKIGTNYKSIYLQMDVSPDGCPPNLAPQYADAIDSYNTQHWSNYTCMTPDSKHPKVASIYTFKTNDSSTANHMFSSGTQIPTSTIKSIVTKDSTPSGMFTQMTSTDTGSVSSIFKCGATITHGWEDTKNYSLGSPPWRTQDIFFDVNVPSCTLNTNYPGSTRIVR